jgi:thioredoxin-like negative regulator of GroEL
VTLGRWQEVPPPGLDEFVEAPGLALLEFWVAWSGASFLVGTAVERILHCRTDLPLRVGRVDADSHPDICARFHAPSPPVLLLFRDGELVGRRSGLITVDSLSRWLDEAVARPQGQAKADAS